MSREDSSVFQAKCFAPEFKACNVLINHVVADSQDEDPTIDTKVEGRDPGQIPTDRYSRLLTMRDLEKKRAHPR